MAEKPTEKIESNPYTFRPSKELDAVLATLTPKQRAAIPRLVKHDLLGLGREDLFKGPNKICHRSVYFENWTKNKVFTAALALALSEARPAVVQSIVTDTVQRLKEIAPLAVDDLARQISGDAHAVQALARVATSQKRPIDERGPAIWSIAKIGTRAATDVLLPLLDDADPEIRKNAAEALGFSAAGLNVQRRLADTAVLDRADRATANKGGAVDEAHELSDEELERIAGTPSP